MDFKRVIRFTNDAGALEKILRLLQSLSQIIAAYAHTSEDARNWLFLRKQFALGRRYFRFFRFLDCFSKAYTSFLELHGLQGLLNLGKWSCLGAYMLMESITIFDAIGVWPNPWAVSFMIEGNRFWFYSLVFSIMWGSIELYQGRLSKSQKARYRIVEKDNGVDRHASQLQAAFLRRTEERLRIRRKLVTDCFDLFIPGHAVGWIHTSSAFVGFASVMSTTLSAKDVWDRV